MKVIRLYTGPDGESHFEDTEIPVLEKPHGSRWSELMKATGVWFVETEGSYSLDWHNASHRQFAIMLAGEQEIEVGDGTKRRLGPGDILLAEDTTGRGHLSRGRNKKQVFITLD